MNKETQKTIFDISSSESTMEIVLKNIYSSCDPHNSNEVPISELIEFIRPYMLEDLSALETLRIMLDPENKNICIDGEQFYNVMNEWAQKIASHSEDENSDEFNRSTSQINEIDEKLLPYTQSTPRASFGQKLLSSQDLLNLSNVSHYNLSPTKQTKDNSIVGQEKTILEEQINQLQYELIKVLGDVDRLKAQLAYSEDQNEHLHDELEKLKTRLQSGPQVNGHVQENKNCLEDMKEEINQGKKRIEELTKKVTLYEKDNNHLNMYVQKLEKENSELEDRCAQLSKTEQSVKKQLIDIKTELDIKEHELTSVTKINDDLRQKLYETKNEVDQLLNQNELLDYKKQGLEKFLTSRRYSLSSHYNTCLDEMSFLSRGNTIPIYTSPLKNQSYSYTNSSPSIIKKVLSPISPNPKDPKSKMLYKVLQSSTPKGSNGLGMRKAFSLNAMSTRSMPNIFCSERSNVVQDQGGDADVVLESLPSDLGFANNGPYESLQMELFQVDPQFDHKDKNGTDFEYDEHIITLKGENEMLQNKVQTLEKENRMLSIESKTSSDRAIALDEKLQKLTVEKQLLEEENKTEAYKLMKDLEDKLAHIQDECSKLKCELDQKEKEIIDITNKFDFESAYKSLEREYGSKISLIEQLQQNHEDDRNTILNLTNKNEGIEKALKDSKKELLETKEKLKTREILTLNIEQTANKVQSHIDGKTANIYELQKLNKDFKCKTDKLEKDLQDKLKQLGHLKDILRRDEVIKNQIYSDNKDLRTSLNELTEDYQKLLKEVGEHENVEKELKEEYNKILYKYNQEVEKNNELSSQLSSHQKDLTEINSKYREMNVIYHEQIDNNVKVREELLYLKSEAESIRENHKTYKNELNKSLHEYQNSLQLLSSKLKDLEFENNILRADLSIEKQKLDRKIKETDYEDAGLKSETESEEEKNKKYSDDASSESSLISFTLEKSTLPTKNRSFEKQKLTIDRLREKLDNQDKAMLNERCKIEILRERLTSKEEELREVKNRNSMEKNSLQSVINDLKDKLAQQENYYEHLCTASNKKIKELSLKLSQLDEIHKTTLVNLSQKESLLHRNFEMYEFNKITIEKLSKTTQDFQIQHKNLTSDLLAKEISLKNVTVENQHLKHFAMKLEKQISELSIKLSCLETALKKCESDLSNKDEKLTSLSSLISDREGRIQALTTAVVEHERNLSNSFLELSAKDSTCTKLQEEIKALKEKLSETEIYGNKTPIRINQSTDGNEDKENKGDGDSTLDKISGFMEVISECCTDLNGAFTKCIEQWKIRIEMDPNFKKLPAIKLCSSFEIDHVLSVFVDNVKAVVLLLNILISSAPSTMEDNADSRLNYGPNKKNDGIAPKEIRKYTLRPSKLQFKRSVSPDSVGIEEESPDDEKSNSEDENNSPDSQNCRTFQLGDGDVESEECVHNVLISDLPILSFDLNLQDAFPHISNSFLDKLGLHENSPKVKLSKDETERLFTTFAIQVALDSKDIKERLQKQKDVYSQLYRKFIYLLKDISTRLRDHKCIGATDSINPVFLMLEDVRFQMQEISQAVGHVGVLTCEQRMTKCWNLVTNYMAIIRQNTEYWKEQSSPKRFSPGGTKSSSSSPENKNVLLEKCKNCDKQNMSKKDKETKEYSRYRRCYSKFSHALTWLSYLPLLFLVGVILVQWQCRMNTEHKICPLDDFIKVLSQTVGNPPY